MTQKARQLYADGVKAYQASRWADARASFLAAWALAKHYTIAGNLGDCELRLGLYRDAAEHLARYVREIEQDKTSSPQERKEGHARFAEARAKVGEVDLQVNVSGAEVYVDGKLAGTAPLEAPIFLDPGTHTVEARSEGLPSTRATIVAKAGAAETLALALKRGPDVPPERPPVRPSLAWIVASGALAAGGLALGTGLTVAANGKGSNVRALQASLKQGASMYPCAGATSGSAAMTCTALDNGLTSQQTLSNAAFTSFMVGGAFALATAGLGVWTALTPKEGRETKPVLSLAPLLGTREGGVVAAGRW
jgi:hypothetical protein